jgi:TM2 domain-containing membrane protein YozV
MESSTRPRSNVVAAVLSLLVPGLGQMYKGRVGLGILWLVLITVAYFTVLLPGILLHFLCIFQAAGMEPRYLAEDARPVERV